MRTKQQLAKKFYQLKLNLLKLEIQCCNVKNKTNKLVRTVPEVNYMFMHMQYAYFLCTLRLFYVPSQFSDIAYKKN